MAGSVDPGRVWPALVRSCGGSRAQPDTLVAVVTGAEWVVESIVEFVPDLTSTATASAEGVMGVGG